MSGSRAKALRRELIARTTNVPTGAWRRLKRRWTATPRPLRGPGVVDAWLEDERETLRRFLSAQPRGALERIYNKVRRR